ncbi:MAG: hypothetical protein ACKE51_06230 [Methylococcaceae bacterium]
MQEDHFISEKRKFQLEEGILILLLLLSIMGIAITDYSPNDGYGYWTIMVFVFALFSVLIAWLQSNHKDGEFKDIIKDQSIHWATTLLIVGGAFLLLKSGHLTPHSASLVVLLILSLAIILDGLRIGLRFSLVGLFLGSSSVLSAFYTTFIWMDIALAIAIVIGTFLWEYWVNKRAEQTANQQYE